MFADYKKKTEEKRGGKIETNKAHTRTCYAFARYVLQPDKIAYLHMTAGS